MVCIFHDICCTSKHLPYSLYMAVKMKTLINHHDAEDKRSASKVILMYRPHARYSLAITELINDIVLSNIERTIYGLRDKRFMCWQEGHFGIYFQSYQASRDTNSTWWLHQMETFSTLRALWAGNSPVTGEFPTQRPVTRSFDVFFGLRLNKLLSKQLWGWWFEMPSCS